MNNKNGLRKTSAQNSHPRNEYRSKAQTRTEDNLSTW